MGLRSNTTWTEWNKTHCKFIPRGLCQHKTCICITTLCGVHEEVLYLLKGCWLHSKQTWLTSNKRNLKTTQHLWQRWPLNKTHTNTLKRYQKGFCWWDCRDARLLVAGAKAGSGGFSLSSCEMMFITAPSGPAFLKAPTPSVGRMSGKKLATPSCSAASAASSPVAPLWDQTARVLFPRFSLILIHNHWEQYLPTKPSDLINTRLIMFAYFHLLPVFGQPWAPMPLKTGLLDALAAARPWWIEDACICGWKLATFN